MARGDSGLSDQPAWRPVPVVGGHTFKAIAAGQDAACALDLSGAAWCWGADDNGQLGLGTTATDLCFGYFPCSKYPVPVTGGHVFEKILSVETTTCAVDLAGAVWCWGENEGGEAGAGAGALPMLRTPTRALTTDSAVQLVGGDNTFCARYAAGTVECWGGNSRGEVGNPVGSRVITPTSPQTSEHFVNLFAGSDGFCGRRADGATFCWGQINGSGNVPVRQAALDPYPVIGGDWRTDGQVLDFQGHLRSIYSGSFFDMGGSVRLTSLGSGAESGCGLGAGGQVWCWGGNSEGELGNAQRFGWSDAYAYPPVPVGGWYPAP
jgi:alpha-tubulin suppressor-like RCC1 family protein